MFQIGIYFTVAESKKKVTLNKSKPRDLYHRLASFLPSPPQLCSSASSFTDTMVTLESGTASLTGARGRKHIT